MAESESPHENSYRNDSVASPLTETDTSASLPKFQTSIAPVSSAEFRTQLELFIADEEALPTTEVIKKAEDAVEWLKATESPLRFLICPWSPEKRADYAKLLETMLQFSQMSEGRRYTACAIYLCFREGTTNDAKINNLTALSLMWMAYLVYPSTVVNYGEFRPTSDEYRPVSSSNIPCFDDVTEQITSDRTYICEMTDFEKLLLERDGFRCVGSKTPSLNKGGLKENKKIPSALTTGTHILPMMVLDYKAKDVGSCAPTWHIVRNYGAFTEDMVKNLDNIIDTPENGMTLTTSLQGTFDAFFWCLLPKGNDDRVWRTHLLTSYLMEGLLDEVVFDDVLASIPIQRKRRPNGIPLPNATFIRFHAAIAHVAHLSGAGEFVDEYIQKYEELDPGLPNGDTFIEYLVGYHSPSEASI